MVKDDNVFLIFFSEEVMEQKFKEMLAKKDHPRPPHHADGKHCPPAAAMFSKCVEMNAYKSCPTDRKVASAECTKLNEFIEKCSPFKNKE